VITKLGIDVLAEELTSSESAVGPFALREVVSSLEDVEAGAVTLQAGVDLLLTSSDGTTPVPVDFILIQADKEIAVKVGTAGSYVTVVKLDDNLAHAYFLATPDGADGVYLTTYSETRIKFWEGSKTP